MKPNGELHEKAGRGRKSGITGKIFSKRLEVALRLKSAPFQICARRSPSIVMSHFFCEKSQCGCEQLSHALFDLGNPIRAPEYLSWFGAICGTDDSILLHEIDKMRGAAIANA
jgi:hypothetical protein